ncbi:MAG: cation transporter [Candidatus Methanomethylophilaceae archaeon]|nr:cation transporter [Candidatus Methanomethylophilaceae archaeon]
MDSAVKENYDFQKIIAVLGVSLMAVKFVAYYLTGSVAILTDALESIVNVVAAFVGLFALYLSAQPADRTHPFGHGKIEVISATVEGVMIIVAGALIIMESVDSLLHPGEIRDLDVGLLIVAFAALANYAVGRIAIRRGRKNRSPALVASGKHLCSDTYSSVGIIIGLFVVYIATLMGYDARWLDSSIAILFGLIIMVTGINVMRQCIDDAMDRADFELLDDVVSLLEEYRHDDWIDVYDLRVVKYGPKIHLDLNVVFPRRMDIDDLEIEKQELDEAIRRKFDESFEISLNAIPCKEFNCRYCNRNCFERDCDFEMRLEWSRDRLCCRDGHSPGNKVTFHEE